MQTPPCRAKKKVSRHCEQRSDEAIQKNTSESLFLASAGMTRIKTGDGTYSARAREPEFTDCVSRGAGGWP
jgi:hypothetical protein